MIAQLADAMGYTAWLAVLTGCVVLHGLYSGMETGIYALNKVRLDLRAEAGGRQARSLRRQLDRPNNLLAGLLIGTNITGYTATFALSAMFVLAGYGGRAEWYTLAVATPILFVFGESVPKNVFRRLAEKMVYRFVRLLDISNAVFTACGLLPAVSGLSWLLMRLTPAGRRGYRPLGHNPIAAILAEGRASGALTGFQSAMADRVMHIADVTLADVMIPMRRVISAPLGISRQQLTRLVQDHNHSRLPMLKEDGSVAGILDIYDVLTAEGDAAPAAATTSPMLLPAGMTVTDALYRMQRAGAAMAVVEDENNKHVGIITIKDLVEEIVGELEAW